MPSLNLHPQNLESIARLKRHSEYYISGADLFLIAENVIFRVHSYFFERESSMFRQELSGREPSTAIEPAEGTSENEAIILPVLASEFEKLLWVIYNPSYSLYDATTQDWLTILNLAHQWRFKNIKDFAIRELEKQSDTSLPLVERVVVYERYGVHPRFLMRHYAALCAPDREMSLDDARTLGVDTVLLISRAREHLAINPPQANKDIEKARALVVRDVAIAMALPSIVQHTMSSPTEERPKPAAQQQTDSTNLKKDQKDKKSVNGSGGQARGS